MIKQLNKMSIKNPAYAHMYSEAISQNTTGRAYKGNHFATPRLYPNLLDHILHQEIPTTNQHIKYRIHLPYSPADSPDPTIDLLTRYRTPQPHFPTTSPWEIKI